jgi:hypothetical protein
MRRLRKRLMSWAKKGLPPSDPVKFFDSKEAIYGIIESKI